MCCCVMENRKVLIVSTYCVKTDRHFNYNFRNNTKNENTRKVFIPAEHLEVFQKITATQALNLDKITSL